MICLVRAFIVSTCDRPNPVQKVAGETFSPNARPLATRKAINGCDYPGEQNVQIPCCFCSKLQCLMRCRAPLPAHCPNYSRCIEFTSRSVRCLCSRGDSTNSFGASVDSSLCMWWRHCGPALLHCVHTSALYLLTVQTTVTHGVDTLHACISALYLLTVSLSHCLTPSPCLCATQRFPPRCRMGFADLAKPQMYENVSDIPFQHGDSVTVDFNSSYFNVHDLQILPMARRLTHECGLEWSDALGVARSFFASELIKKYRAMHKVTNVRITFILDVSLATPRFTQRLLSLNIT